MVFMPDPYGPFWPQSNEQSVLRCGGTNWYPRPERPSSPSGPDMRLLMLKALARSDRFPLTSMCKQTWHRALIRPVVEETGSHFSRVLVKAAVMDGIPRR